MFIRTDFNPKSLSYPIKFSTVKFVFSCQNFTLQFKSTTQKATEYIFKIILSKKNRTCTWSRKVLERLNCILYTSPQYTNASWSFSILPNPNNN